MDKFKINKTKMPANITKKAPTIMMAGGIGLFGFAIAMAIHQTPKYHVILNDISSEMSEIDTKLKVATAVKVYWPVAALSGSGAALIIAAHTEQEKRNAALNAAATLATTALKDYKNEVVKKLGEDKAKEVQQAIAERKVKDTPVDEKTAKTVIIAGSQDYLCFDVMSGRYFRSNIDKLQRELNTFNQYLMQAVTLTLNEWYDQIGLEPIKAGYELQWDIQNGLVEMSTNWITKEDTNEPVLVVDFLCGPTGIR